MELMNFPVDYEEKSTCEDLVNTKVVSNTNNVQACNNNYRYRSYAESNISTIKSSMASLQVCVGGTQNPEFPGRSKITVFPRAMVFSHMTAVTVAV